MTRPAAWGAALLTLLTPLAAAHAQGGGVESRSQEPSPWHLDVDLAYGRTRVGFVGMQNVTGCPDGGCGPAGYDVDTARLSAALGHAGFNLEGSLTAPLAGPSPGYAALSAGLRIDTGWDAVLSLTLRMAYVRRLGDAPGEGGRGGIGINLRPVVGVVLHGGISADVTGVPATMNRTFFSWSTFVGGGLRLSFGH